MIFFSNKAYRAIESEGMTHWCWPQFVMTHEMCLYDIYDIYVHILMSQQLHISQWHFYPQTFLGNIGLNVVMELPCMGFAFPTRIFCRGVSGIVLHSNGDLSLVLINLTISELSKNEDISIWECAHNLSYTISPVSLWIKGWHLYTPVLKPFHNIQKFIETCLTPGKYQI